MKKEAIVTVAMEPKLLLHFEEEYRYLEEAIEQITEPLTDDIIRTFVRDQVPGALMMLFFVYSRLTHRLHYCGADKLVKIRLKAETVKQNKNRSYLRKTYFTFDGVTLCQEQIPMEIKYKNKKTGEIEEIKSYQSLHIIFDKESKAIQKWHEKNKKVDYEENICKHFRDFLRQHKGEIVKSKSWGNYKEKLREKKKWTPNLYHNASVDQLIKIASCFYFQIPNTVNSDFPLGVGFIFDVIEDGLAVRNEIEKQISSCELRCIKELDDKIGRLLKKVLEEKNEQIVEVDEVYAEYEMLTQIYKGFKKSDNSNKIREIISGIKKIIQGKIAENIGKMISPEIEMIQDSLEDFFQNFSRCELKYWREKKRNCHDSESKPLKNNNEEKIEEKLFSYIQNLPRSVAQKSVYQFINELIKEFTPLGSYIDIFRQHEHLLMQLRGYRAHLCHSYKECLYGIEILNKEKFCLKKTLVESLISKDKKQENARVALDDKTIADMAKFLWTYTVFSHDIGYTIEKFSEWSKELFQLVAKAESEGEKIPVELNVAYIMLQAQANKYIDMAIEYYLNKIEIQDLDRKKEFKRNLWESLIVRKSHPIFSTIMLLQSQKKEGISPWLKVKESLGAFEDIFSHVEDREKTLWKCFLPPISFAILSHHMSKWPGVRKANLKVEFDKFPLAFFLAFCDLVQETGRPGGDKIESRKAFGMTEISVNNNEKKIVATINYGLGDLERELKEEIRLFRLLSENLKDEPDISYFFNLFGNLKSEIKISCEKDKDGDHVFIFDNSQIKLNCLKEFLREAGLSPIKDIKGPRKVFYYRANGKFGFTEMEESEKINKEVKQCLAKNDNNMAKLKEFLKKIDTYELDKRTYQVSKNKNNISLSKINEQPEKSVEKLHTLLKENIKNKFLSFANTIGRIIKKIDDLYEFFELYKLLPDSNSLQEVEIRLKTGLEKTDGYVFKISSKDNPPWHRRRLHPSCIYTVLNCNIEKLLENIRIQHIQKELLEIDYKEEIIQSHKFKDNQNKVINGDKILVIGCGTGADLINYYLFNKKKIHGSESDSESIEAYEKWIEELKKCDGSISNIANNIHKTNCLLNEVERAIRWWNYQYIVSQDYVSTLSTEELRKFLDLHKNLSPNVVSIHAFVYDDPAKIWGKTAEGISKEKYKNEITKKFANNHSCLEVGLAVLKNITEYHPVNGGWVNMELKCSRLLLIIKRKKQ